MAARTDVAVVRLGVLIAAHTDRAAVLHKDLDRAPLRAALASAGNPLTLAGAAPLLLRGAIAALTGGCVVQPAASRPAVVADAWMKDLRVSLMDSTPPDTMCAGPACERTKSDLGRRSSSHGSRAGARCRTG
jgi:hypothetical protein